MNRNRRVPSLSQAAFLWLLAARICYGGGWDFTAPGDPNRSWGVTLATSVTYDDNLQSTEKNRQSDIGTTGDAKFRANFALERLFLGTQYEYWISYPRDVKAGGENQSHTLNLSANYTVSPRLLLGVTENFVQSIEPQLVLGPANAPVSVVQAGTYVYNTVGATLSYALTPRWTVSANGIWDIWRYQDATIAAGNDHEDYSMLLSALYALDTRTTVGVNYQYTEDTYVNPGPRNGLNGYSNTGYLSAVRRFNPYLSLTLNGGYTIRNSEDGSVNESPSALASLVYNYGPQSTISLMAAESLSVASVQFSRSYSAQQNTSLSLQVNHRFTRKFHAIGEATYSYSTFVQPLFGVITVKPHEETITGHFGLTYDLKDWVLLNMNYFRTDLVSSDRFLIQPYSRDQISVGMTLVY